MNDDPKPPYVAGGPWTTHGHPVPGVTVEGNGRPPVARCGGPALCAQCGREAASLQMTHGTLRPTPEPTTTPPPGLDLGRVAFEAYLTGLAPHMGQMNWSWNGLAPVDREAWRACADGVRMFLETREAATARDEIEHQTARAEKAEAALLMIQGVGFHDYAPPLPLEYGCVFRGGEGNLACGAEADHPVHNVAAQWKTAGVYAEKSSTPAPADSPIPMPAGYVYVGPPVSKEPALALIAFLESKWCHHCDDLHLSAGQFRALIDLARIGASGMLPPAACSCFGVQHVDPSCRAHGTELHRPTAPAPADTPET